MVFFLVVASVFCLRIIKFATEPEFEIGIERYHRTTYEFNGVALKKQMESGTLEVHADQMRPGALFLDDFKSGPPTLLWLLGVNAKYSDNSGKVWMILALTASLGNDQIEFKKNLTVLYPDGRQISYKSMKLDFTTGRFYVR